MPGLYADENVPLPVVQELRRLGFDVLTMYEDDKANQSLTDEAVLSIASDINDLRFHDLRPTTVGTNQRLEYQL